MTQLLTDEEWNTCSKYAYLSKHFREGKPHLDPLLLASTSTDGPMSANRLKTTLPRLLPTRLSPPVAYPPRLLRTQSWCHLMSSPPWSTLNTGWPHYPSVEETFTPFIELPGSRLPWLGTMQTQRIGHTARTVSTPFPLQSCFQDPPGEI